MFMLLPSSAQLTSRSQHPWPTFQFGLVSSSRSTPYDGRNVIGCASVERRTVTPGGTAAALAAPSASALAAASVLGATGTAGGAASTVGGGRAAADGARVPAIDRANQ